MKYNIECYIDIIYLSRKIQCTFGLTIQIQNLVFLLHISIDIVGSIEEKPMEIQNNYVE